MSLQTNGNDLEKYKVVKSNETPVWEGKAEMKYPPTL
jgi:hypothetical protein